MGDSGHSHRAQARSHKGVLREYPRKEKGQDKAWPLSRE